MNTSAPMRRLPIPNMFRLIHALTVVALLGSGSAAHALTAAEVFAKARSAVYLIIVTSDEPGVVDVVAQGSAVLIAPGRFVTNCHVLERGKHFVVSRREDKIVERVQLVNFERGKDLCELDLMQPKPGFDHPVTFAPTDSWQIGAPVFAIGSPRGMELSLSTGVISGVRDVRGMKLIQTTAPFSAGSSGGGLFDEQARLVGITTLIAKDSQNLNFAVPAQYIASAGVAAAELFRQRNGISPGATPEIAFERQERLRREEQDIIDARKKQLAQPRTANQEKTNVPVPGPAAPAVAAPRKPLATRLALYEQMGDPALPAKTHEQLAKQGSLAGLDDDGTIRKVYEALIRKHITEQLRWREGGDYVAEFQVQLRRNGEIMFVLPLRPSGDEQFDQEARRAIGAASPLPVPRDNEVFAQMSTLSIAVQAPAPVRPAARKPAPPQPAPLKPAPPKKKPK